MRRYIEDPFKPDRFDIEAMQNAESINEIKKMNALCGKTNGDATFCIKCTDLKCKVGKKVRALLEKETAPKYDANSEPEHKKAAENAPSDGANDPDHDYYVNAVNSVRGPIKWLMSVHQFLSSKPKRFSRRDAIEFLTKFQFMYPDVKTTVSIEDALRQEEQKDYADITRKIQSGSSEGFVASFYAKIYNIKIEEAAAYISSLRDKYEDSDVTFQNKKENLEDLDEQYEAFREQQAELLERLEIRKDEIREELDLIEKMMELYDGIIKKIRDSEQKLALYPEESPLEDDDDLIDLPLILDEESEESEEEDE